MNLNIVVEKEVALEYWVVIAELSVRPKVGF